MRHHYILSAFFSIVFLLVSSALVAQTSSPNHVDGAIYFKIKNNAGIVLPDVQSVDELDKLTSMGLTDLANLFQIYGLTSLERPFTILHNEDLDNTYELEFDQIGLELELVDRLSNLAYMDYAERVPLFKTNFVPNDFPGGANNYLRVINAPDAWDITTGSDNAVIAIVDAGTLTTHPDLAANIWENPGEIKGNGIDDDGNGYVDDINGWDAGDNDPDPNPPIGIAGIGGVDSFSHGTLVAGCASAVTNNNRDIASIGYSCKIMAIKAKPDNTWNASGLRNTTQGIVYAIAAGADVINMSFGLENNFNVTVQNIITDGHNKGIVFIGAAGNDNSSGQFHPASYTHVINVASTNNSDRKANFSNYGSSVDISAPGVGIPCLSHSNNGNPNVENAQGTSMSAPIVSGLVGLMLSVNPCLTPDEVENILKLTSVNIDALNPTFAGQLGAGRIDAAAAVAAAQPTAAPVANFTVLDDDPCDDKIQLVYAGQTSNCPQNVFWSVNGQNSDELNPVFKFSQSGTYNVTLVVNNGVGTNQISRPLTVTIGTQIKLDAGGGVDKVINTCFGQQIVLNASASPSTGVTYQWSPATGLSSTNVLQPNLLTSSSRTYTLTATHTASGCEFTDQVNISVDIVNVEAGPDVAIQPGNSTQLNAVGCGNMISYKWSPSNGLDMDDIPNPVASPSVSRLYTVTVTDQFGNSASDEVLVDVDPAASLDKAFSQVGTVRAAYPNPAQQEVILSADLQQAGDLKITAYDLMGRRVATLFDEKVWQGEFKLTWTRDHAIENGVYLLTWQMNGAQYVQKVQLN